MIGRGRSTAHLKLALFLFCTLAVLAFSASRADAAVPWWHTLTLSAPPERAPKKVRSCSMRRTSAMRPRAMKRTL